jgi:hypothetical protein
VPERSVVQKESGGVVRKERGRHTLNCLMMDWRKEERV